MTRRPFATVRVLRLPHLHPDAVRVEVDCRYSTTGITSLPHGPIDLERKQLITAAAFAHEERCGQCDTTEAHDQGDQHIRAHIDRAVAEYQHRQALAYARERRN